MTNTFTFNTSADEETVDIYLNGNHVANVNYDDHGWTALTLVERTVEKIAEVIGAEIVREYSDNEN